jgi:hypothetical protein
VLPTWRRNNTVLAASLPGEPSTEGKVAVMDPEKFTEAVRAFRARTPFKPFTVATVSGNRYEIDFPDAIVVREGVAIFIGPGGVPVLFDHESVSEVIGDQFGRGTEAS